MVVNKNHGRVVYVSKNRDSIRIRTPRGGELACRNEGFEIGDQVCYVLDALNRTVIKVMPKDVADAKVAIGSDVLLQMAIAEEVTDGEENEASDGTGSGTEGYIDQISQTYREIDFGECDYSENSPELYDTAGPESGRKFETDLAREAYNWDLYLSGDWA